MKGTGIFAKGTVPFILHPDAKLLSFGTGSRIAMFPRLPFGDNDSAQPTGVPP